MSIFLSPGLNASDVASLEREIAGLDRAITSRQQEINAENAKLVDELPVLERELSGHERRLERHERRIERADERIQFVEKNISELNSWYEGLGAIDKGLNSNNYESTMSAHRADQGVARTELRDLNNEKTQIDTEIQSTKNRINEHNLKVKNASQVASNDVRLRDLQRQKDSKVAELNKLAAAQKKPPESTEPVHKAYVYAVSGRRSGEVEKVLNLRKWVESYQAKYIEANWNDLTASDNPASGSMIKFLGQIEREFAKIPPQSNIILIGYGMGGGAAILAATEIANKTNRRIDFLVTIDPMGMGDSRMNIVYRTDASCQARISPQQYVDCLSKARKREITPNVKNFYNRWQREASVPMDAMDRIKIGDREYSMSTGKFLVASSATNENQKRMYYGTDKKAHELILIDAAADLPRLLVEHLR